MSDSVMSDSAMLDSVACKSSGLLRVWQSTLKIKVDVPIERSPVIYTYQARIYVTLRPSVLDPAGTAVQSGLTQLGYDTVEQVRIGKYVELQLTAADEGSARTQLDQICDRLLANPVIENYRFDLSEVSATVGAG